MGTVASTVILSDAAGVGALSSATGAITGAMFGDSTAGGTWKLAAIGAIGGALGGAVIGATGSCLMRDPYEGTVVATSAIEYETESVPLQWVDTDW